MMKVNLNYRMDFRSKISKEELSALPRSGFKGKIINVVNKHQLHKVIPFLKEQKVLGFDTETKPSFKKGRNNTVSLLQLAVSDIAFIFRLRSTGLPKELIHILADDSILKVGVAIHDDIKALQNLRFFRPGGFLELQSFVKEFGIENFSLKKLCGIVLGIRISKKQQLSDWSNPILTEAQQEYAATDAWAAFEIFMTLNNNGGLDGAKSKKLFKHAG